MKCHIPTANVKVLGKAIQTLSRIGDELYVEPHADGIYFRTVNAQRSAFATFNFARSFFLYFSVSDDDNAASSQADLEPEKCKVPMKSCLSVFRTQNLNIEMCKLSFSQNGRVLVFQLCCRHSIKKTYNVPVIETETLQASYNKNNTQNKLLSQSKVLIDALQNFQKTQDEITVTVTAARVWLRNFSDAGDAMKNAVRTELTLEPSEFDSFHIGVETTITFSLKELRALLSFAEFFNIAVSGHFDTPGRPIVFCLSNTPTFEAQFVLATMTENDTFSQSQQSLNSSQASSVNEVARKRPSTTIDHDHSSQKRLSVQPEKANETPVVSLDGLDDDELEQIDMLEANAATSTPSLAPAVIRAQKYYFPGCFGTGTDQPPKPISPDKILAYDSQEEDN